MCVCAYFCVSVHASVWCRDGAGWNTKGCRCRTVTVATDEEQLLSVLLCCMLHVADSASPCPHGQVLRYSKPCMGWIGGNNEQPGKPSFFFASIPSRPLCDRCDDRYRTCDSNEKMLEKAFEPALSCFNCSPPFLSYKRCDSS